jgi:hypothetical protein
VCSPWGLAVKGRVVCGGKYNTSTLTRREIRRLHNFKKEIQKPGTTYFPALANSFLLSGFGIPPISSKPRLLHGFKPIHGFNINRLGCKPFTQFLSSFTLAILIDFFHNTF